MTIARPAGTQTTADTTEQAFAELFKTHFKGLHGYAWSILRDTHLAEEMVQTVFVKVYERGIADKLAITGPIEAYLYRSVYNECLNYRKHERVKAKYRAHASRNTEEAANLDRHADYKVLEATLETALNELPEQCRTVFLLSRFQDLRYREIAQTMDISVKTVENQMGKALRILREKLKAYLVVLLIIILTNL